MGTLVCTVTLDKVRGVSVVVEDADAKLKQTIAIDGKTIELTVAGTDGTTVVTQSPTSVVVTCKDFEVKAENSIALTAKGKVAIQGQEVTATGQTKVGLTGGQTSTLSLESQGAALSGQRTSVRGEAQASLGGGVVDVAADMSLEVSSTGAATLKGAMTNVQGNMVMVG